MTVPIVDPPSPPRPDNALAFLLAPGIAALVGGLGADAFVLCAHPVQWAAVVAAPVLLAVCFALVGYATAAIVAVPIFLALPERARGCFAFVVPLAGTIAAAPWLLLLAPWNHGTADIPLLGIPFGLGVVAGIAFLFLRRVPDPEDGASLR